MNSSRGCRTGGTSRGRTQRVRRSPPSSVSAAEKRAALRERLRSNDLIVMPGALNPRSARLERTTAPTAATCTIAADLGLPDIVLTTSSEVADRGAHVSWSPDLPTLVDADSGFGEPMNVARMVQALEDAGVSGLPIEDQVNPKRCGHVRVRTGPPLDPRLSASNRVTGARKGPPSRMAGRPFTGHALKRFHSRVMTSSRSPVGDTFHSAPSQKSSGI